MYSLVEVIRRKPATLLAYQWQPSLVGDTLPEFIKLSKADELLGREEDTAYTCNDVTGDLWVLDDGDWIVLENGEPVDVVSNDYFTLHYERAQTSTVNPPLWIKDLTEVAWNGTYLVPKIDHLLMTLISGEPLAAGDYLTISTKDGKAYKTRQGERYQAVAPVSVLENQPIQVRVR